MIVGIGTDIVSVPRIEKSLARFGGSFLDRILTPEERALCPEGARRTAFIAGRWAAKEAASKALGTGFSEGIGPSSIGILPDAAGAPRLVLGEPAKSRAESLRADRLHVTISHDAGCAVAFVILEDSHV